MLGGTKQCAQRSFPFATKLVYKSRERHAVATVSNQESNHRMIDIRTSLFSEAICESGRAFKLYITLGNYEYR